MKMTHGTVCYNFKYNKTTVIHVYSITRNEAQQNNNITTEKSAYAAIIKKHNKSKELQRYIQQPFTILHIQL